LDPGKRPEVTMSAYEEPEGEREEGKDCCVCGWGDLGILTIQHRQTSHHDAGQGNAALRGGVLSKDTPPLPWRHLSPRGDSPKQVRRASPQGKRGGGGISAIRRRHLHSTALNWRAFQSCGRVCSRWAPDAGVAVAALPPLQAAPADPSCCPATTAGFAESGAPAADVSAAILKLSDVSCVNPPPPPPPSPLPSPSSPADSPAPSPATAAADALPSTAARLSGSAAGLAAGPSAAAGAAWANSTGEHPPPPPPP